MGVAKAVFLLSEHEIYNGSEPFFYSAEGQAWAQQLEAGYTVIRDEMDEIISGKKRIKLSSPNPPYLSKPDGWKNIYFFNFMWQYHANCKRFPKTYALLKSIPNLTFAEFTVLEPHSRVLPHVGETNTTTRGHLGIAIPAPLPLCGIQVGNEQRSWQQGKVVLFSDCHRHTVWNDSDERRFVLVFDITKPEFEHQLLWVNAQSLSALTIKFIVTKIPFLEATPKPIKSAFHKMFAAIWFLYLPFQRITLY